jgi:hypothetical protein
MDPSAVADGPAAVRWISCAPNPLVDGTAVRFALSSSQDALIEVLAADGRVVRTIPAGRSGTGERAVEWDRTDAAGKRVASGVYFLRMRGAGETVVGPKLIAIR